MSNQGFELGLNAQTLTGAPPWASTWASTCPRTATSSSAWAGWRPRSCRASTPPPAGPHQLYVEGFPLGAIFLKRVVSADIEGTRRGRARHERDVRGRRRSCRGRPTSPRGGGAAVPCGQAPLHLPRARPSRRRSDRSATLTLFNNLQLYAQVDYQGGHTWWTETRPAPTCSSATPGEILERDDPILLAYESLGSDGINQAGLIDASFVKLRRLSATYNVPARLARRASAPIGSRSPSRRRTSSPSGRPRTRCSATASSGPEMRDTPGNGHRPRRAERLPAGGVAAAPPLPGHRPGDLLSARRSPDREHHHRTSRSEPI